MIVVVTFREDGVVWVSHGYCSETGRNVVLQQAPIVEYGRMVEFNRTIGEYVLKDTSPT